jgi:hypothetical protein
MNRRQSPSDTYAFSVLDPLGVKGISFKLLLARELFS